MTDGILLFLFRFLFGLEDLRSVQSVRFSFDEAWAAHPFWVVLGCSVLASAGVLSYLLFEPRMKPGWRFLGACLRGGVLALIFFIAADPVLRFVYGHIPRPLLYVVFDTSESMGIRDKLEGKEEAALRKAAGLKPDSRGRPPSRLEVLQGLLRREDDNVLEALAERCRLRAFVIDRQGLRAVKLTERADGAPDGSFVASKLTATAPVTPIGKALADLVSRHKRENLGGVVIFSDFNKNSGPDPDTPAARLGRPVYTVGFGPTETKDLSVKINASPVLKKAERESLIVTLQQSQLGRESTRVRVTAEPLTATGAPDRERKIKVIGEKTVTLEDARTVVNFDFVPDDTGRFRLVAAAEPLDGESVEENNTVTREVSIRDDFMRLLYVAYEPNWEWRFIKEVFHRDKLVGMRGFRTFLHASDADVRRSNPLFLERLDSARGEFFTNDVIFLGDVPAEGVSTRFADMVKEFVGRFGGGLVVMAGPIYGPAQLARTPLVDMLPVVVDPKSRRRDRRAFRPRLTAAAGDFSFMRLGSTPKESREAWSNMGRLPWYQPAKKVHPLGKVLLEHPTDTCSDGETPQPIIAVRRYGKGEVVYLAFDETWRLRRMFGAKYYRQFWGQMIYRLGLGHTMGSQKRFIVRTDRTRYQVDDELRLTVDAFDEDFRPLTREKLPRGVLEADLFFTDEDGKTRAPRRLNVPLAREARGGFELSMPLLEAGDYRISVRDHVTGEPAEVVFAVTRLSAEHQSAVRNIGLEEALTRATGGKVYDPKTVAKLAGEMKFAELQTTTVDRRWLASTIAGFGLLFLLAVVEWAMRKWVNVP